MNNPFVRRPLSGLAFLLFPFSFLLFPNSLPAQISSHGNIWYFGYGAGLDFSSGQPVKLTGINVDSYEGCAIYCDANGDLLFYTNGGGIGDNPNLGQRDGLIWNRQQQVMYSMDTTQGGGYSAAQSALILPTPGKPGTYGLFTMDHNPSLADPATNRGLSYFEIDMAANGGLGAVTTANQTVFTLATEALTAVPGTGGTAFHVIITDAGAANQFITIAYQNNGFGATLFSERVDTTPVTVLKASPDGRWVCANGELYTFDAGLLTHRATVPASTYTFSFSPAGRYLYAFLDDSGITPMVRYDLEASNIAASADTVTEEGLITFAGLMQLGPDGNIYYVEQLEDQVMSISTVRCPDGAAPTVVHDLFQFDTDPEGVGLFTSLPNFADYIFARNPENETVMVTVGCDSMVILQPAQSGVSYLWSTGAITPTIKVDGPDTVSVTVQDSCGFTTTTFEVRETCCNPVFPNVFTPNGDVINDTFAPNFDNCELDLFEFNVYSRWGELVFQGFTPAERWDGTINGNPAPSDAYVYSLRYKRKGEPEKFESQSVTLLR